MTQNNLDQFDSLLKNLFRSIAKDRGAPFGVTSIQRKLCICGDLAHRMMDTALEKGFVVFTNKPYLFNSNVND